MDFIGRMMPTAPAARVSSFMGTARNGRFSRTGAFLALAGFMGCSGLRHLAGQEFMKRAADIELMSSGQHTAYIGTAGDRVYLQFWAIHPVSSRNIHVVYWTEIDGLPAHIRNELRSGRNPWTPWEVRRSSGPAPVVGDPPATRE